MPSLILTLDQLLFTLSTSIADLLFIGTVPTNHRNPIDNFMLLDSIEIMALVTTERPTATCVTNPSEI
jgi:hypothetical protein